MMHNRVQSCCQALQLGEQAEGGDLLIPVLDSVSEQLDNLPVATASELKECLARTLHCQLTQDLIAQADELYYVLLHLIEAVSPCDV